VRYQLRHPYFAVGVIGIALAIATVQGGANSPDLIDANNGAGEIQSGNQTVTLLIDVWRDLVRNLSGIAAQVTPRSKLADPSQTGPPSAPLCRTIQRRTCCRRSALFPSGFSNARSSRRPRLLHIVRLSQIQTAVNRP
jgi:hypothetical protein